MGREVELKLEIEPRDTALLRDKLFFADSEAGEQDQLSVYFDTPKRKLRKAGFSLRVRSARDGFVQTVKADSAGAGMFDRPEWETAVGSLAPDADAASDTPLRDLLPPRSFAKLEPIVRSQVRRTVWPITFDGSDIDVTLDEGAVSSGDIEQGLSELELELRFGDPAALLAVAREIARDVPLRLGVLTKAERGFALADGLFEQVTKAPPVKVAASMSAADGFTAIVLSCLKHFRLNEPLVVIGRQPEALHQARVAMRRLRSALSLFRPLFREDAQFAGLREELRWFTAQLGEARNLDVFLGRLAADAPERAPLQVRREEAYELVTAALASERFREMMLDLVGWLVTSPWRQGDAGQRRLRDFTNRRIDKLWAAIAARGGALADLEEEPRHRLRIDIKKLRYALEFVQGLHSKSAARQKSFIDALEAMQESLGHLNDLATAREIARDHLGGAEGENEADWIISPNPGIAMIDEAERAFRKAVRIGPYWRRKAPRPPANERTCVQPFTRLAKDASRPPA